MGRFAEYPSFDALGLSGLVRRGEVTPLELVDEAIARIEALDPRLNAVVHRFFERARAAARGPLPDGPLRGVPMLLKDLSSRLAGAPLTNGSRFFEGWVPGRSTALVDRLLAAGLVMVGRTNAAEFGLAPVTEPALHGPARNPWDTSRSPGGSSGGAAAAVAARMVPLGGGSDGGGSIRIPAACCGLFGLKPTRGRTPVGPFQAEQWSGFGVEHVVTVTVRDSAAVLDAVAGPLPGDLHALPRPASPFLDEVGRDPGRLRVAWTGRPLLAGPGCRLHPECRAALEAAVALLTELGHECVEAAPPLDARDFTRAYLVAVAASVHADLREAERELGRRVRRGDLEQRTWLAFRLGGAVGATAYLTARHRLAAIARGALEALRGFDLLLTPTLTAPPPPLGALEPRGLAAAALELAGRLPAPSLLAYGPALDHVAGPLFDLAAFTALANVTGQPSMSVPLHWTAEGLPVGLTFTARAGDEVTLLRLAAQLEAARPWSDRRPACS